MGNCNGGEEDNEFVYEGQEKPKENPQLGNHMGSSGMTNLDGSVNPWFPDENLNGKDYIEFL